MSIRSDDGLCAGARHVGDIEVTISVKTVNHRGLDLHFYMGAGMDPFEAAMRVDDQEIRRTRPHRRARPTGVLIRRLRESASTGRVCRPIWRRYQEAAQQYAIDAKPDLNCRVPGSRVCSATAGGIELPAVIRSSLSSQLLEQALSDSERVSSARRRRTRRGDAGTQSRHRAKRPSRSRKSAQTRPARFTARLRERLAELLGGANLDPQRLAQEAAMLADRSDIGEEISRLKIHVRPGGGTPDWRRARSGRSSIFCCRR